MTLGTVTRTQVHCDATIPAACDTQHPDDPHTCPEVLEVHSANVNTIHTAATTDGWTIRYPRHYCPAHRDQADPPQTPNPWTPCWRSECRTACAYNLTACTATPRTPR